MTLMTWLFPVFQGIFDGMPALTIYQSGHRLAAHLRHKSPA